MRDEFKIVIYAFIVATMVTSCVYTIARKINNAETNECIAKGGNIILRTPLQNTCAKIEIIK